jgi:toxin-antitoxin system PIN domain toxin
MLLDANVLLYAVDSNARQHQRAVRWLEDRLAGTERVGMPWLSLTAFVRIATHPRASERPLDAADAWQIVQQWLDVPIVWTPGATERHAEVFGALIRRYRPTGNLVTDAHLAAIAIEHGIELVSADTDFARFSELRWSNPFTD